VVDLPAGEGGKTKIDWHGMPAAKYLQVSPGAEEGADFQCKYAPTATGYPCTMADIKKRLQDAWGLHSQ
jgi:hypothetical protein